MRDIDIRWLYEVLQTLDLKKLDTSTGVPGLNRKDAYETFVTVPPIAEQRRIVEVLDAVIGKEEAIRAQIAKQSAILSGLVEDLVGDSQGHQFTDLGKVASISGGVTLGRDVPDSVSVELPYLRVANVQDGRIDCSDMKTIRVLRSEVERYSVRKGDLLLTEGGDFDKLGRGAVWRGEIDPCLHQNHVFRVRCGEHLNPYYLSLYVSSSAGKRYFLGVAKQTTNLASINLSQLKAMPVPVPELSRQRRVVEFVTSCKRKKSDLECELEKLRSAKRGLIKDLLAGKV